MASSLDGEIEIFADNTYANEWDSLINHSILDADVYGFAGVLVGSVIDIDGVANDVFDIVGRI